ncbi:hypothetical protein [Spiroplasma endosymbiont of Notiophilus biguttatus]|uniref:hypothetical protein n=1 Tax=Spiroplasma endosymbiont of Notiophilus biguttatus TaxID=3066285 RepID=UPI00313AC50D
MRKILKVFKVMFLTSIISLPLIACDKVNDANQKYVDISNINMEVTNAPVELNKDSYNTTLIKFKAKVQTKINEWVPEGKKPENGADYKITILNHDNMYAKINKFESLAVNVSASNNSNILKGSFNACVKLVPKAKDISNINIDKQEEKIKINTTTFVETIALDCLLLIESQINAIVPTAKQDSDYLVNVEGHSLSESIKTFDSVNINVNAIEDDYHFLLHGSFSFVLAFVKD